MTWPAFASDERTSYWQFDDNDGAVSMVGRAAKRVCDLHVIRKCWDPLIQANDRGSEQRFVWVIRVPTTINGSNDPKSHLPEGFLIRTSQVGQVVGGWAPQVDILSHPSTGGFLSHCGWSSTSESLINGVPLVTWLLYAEQQMNASFLAEELGVAIRPKVLLAKKMVWREEIAMMVKKILVANEGHTMREKAKEIQRTARKAIGNTMRVIHKQSSDSNRWFHPRAR